MSCSYIYSWAYSYLLGGLASAGSVVFPSPCSVVGSTKANIGVLIFISCILLCISISHFWFIQKMVLGDYKALCRHIFKAVIRNLNHLVSNPALKPQLLGRSRLKQKQTGES